MHMVVFRLHGKLNMETAYIGPFAEFEDAYEYLCELPALGICPDGENAGVKFVQELQKPDLLKAVVPSYFGGIASAFTEILEGGNTRCIGIVTWADGSVDFEIGSVETTVAGKWYDVGMYYDYTNASKMIMGSVNAWNTAPKGEANVR